MRRKLSIALLIALTISAGLLLYYQWDYLFGPGIVLDRKIDREDALRLWNGFTTRFPIEPTGTGPALLADVNDDGTIDEQDREHIASGTAEWMRVDDTVCNGRTHVHDRTPFLDDDLQCIVLRLPPDTPRETTLDLLNHESHYFEVFRSDWLDERVRVRWPVRVDELDTAEGDISTIPLWLRAPLGTPVDAPIEFALRLQAPGAAGVDLSLRIQVVDGLGHPGYFAAARDYLMERDRRDSPQPKVFRDAIECASSENPNEYEMMHLVAMRHEATKFEVLETCYDVPLLQPRVKDIFGAAARHPEQTVIVNGNYFHVDDGGLVPHGRSCLGAVIHDHTVSPATGRHWWFTYPNDGRPRDADWFYTSYCLVQEQDRAGTLELREEPLEPNPYIPRIERDGREIPAQNALGGINTIHNFIHSVCGRKSHVWIARVSPLAGSDEHKLVCLAMTDTVSSTSFCGGPAFRQKLRDSGLIIEEGDVARGIPPGKSELAYFDGGASIAMAVNVDGEFEFPTFTSRHEPRNRHVHVNNYAMFQVVDDD